MNLATAQQVSTLLAQINGLNISIAAVQNAISAGTTLSFIQLQSGPQIDLTQIGLTPGNTATILTSLLNFLTNLQTTATANLTAVP